MTARTFIIVTVMCDVIFFLQTSAGSATRDFVEEFYDFNVPESHLESLPAISLNGMFLRNLCFRINST